MRDLALELIRGGVSVIPIRADGSKRPALKSWDRYKIERRPTEKEVCAWFPDGAKIGAAVLCGAISGNISVFDFETKDVYSAWAEIVKVEMPEVLESLPISTTPRGMHVYTRTKKPRRGCRLAMEMVTDDKDGPSKEKPQTLIEIRGDGQYVIAPGSPGACHKSGVGWGEKRWGSPIAETPVISDEEYEALVGYAKSFNEAPEMARRVVDGLGKVALDDQRPGTDYCRRSTLGEFRALMEAHDWTVIREDRSHRLILRRPGKDDPGGSATLGFCTTSLGETLYVFSTNASPFRADTCYSAFAARAIMEFASDWKACARQCGADGYGAQPPEEVREEIDRYIAMAKKLETEVGHCIPDDQIQAYRTASGKFKKLWDRKRTEIGDDHPERYDTCLLHFGYHKLSTPTISGLEMGIRLIREWRRRYRTEPDKAWDREYMQRKVESIRRMAGVESDVDVVKKEIGEAGGNTRKSVMRWASKEILGFPIVGLVQVGPKHGEATYYFVCRGGLRVRIGDGKELRDPKHVEIVIYAHREEDGSGVPGFKGSIPAVSKDKIKWEALIEELYVYIDVEHADKRMGSDLITYIGQYLASKQTRDAAGDDDWKGALPQARPFVRDGRAYVHIESIRDYLNNHHGLKWNNYDCVVQFNDLGMVSDPKRPERATIDGTRYSVRYWSIEMDRLSQPEPEPEIVET